MIRDHMISQWLLNIRDLMFDSLTCSLSATWGHSGTSWQTLIRWRSLPFHIAHRRSETASNIFGEFSSWSLFSNWSVSLRLSLVYQVLRQLFGCRHEYWLIGQAIRANNRISNLMIVHDTWRIFNRGKHLVIYRGSRLRNWLIIGIDSETLNAFMWGILVIILVRLWFGRTLILQGNIGIVYGSHDLRRGFRSVIKIIYHFTEGLVFFLLSLLSIWYFRQILKITFFLLEMRSNLISRR